MLLVKSMKILVFGGVMLPLAMGALGTGILFSSYNIAVARNPDESENLYNSTLAGFALVESFVFMSIFIASVVSYLF